MGGAKGERVASRVESLVGRCRTFHICHGLFDFVLTYGQDEAVRYLRFLSAGPPTWKLHLMGLLAGIQGLQASTLLVPPGHGRCFNTPSSSGQST